MIYAEQQMADTETDQIVQCYGQQIQLFAPQEPQIERDRYGSITRRNEATAPTYSFLAFPIRYNPTDRDLQKAGIAISVDVIFWVSRLQFDRLSITWKTIDQIKWRVLHEAPAGSNPINFNVTAVGIAGHIGVVHRYVTIGAKK